MDRQTKSKWLNRILFVKVMVTLFVWGLPAFWGNAWFLGLSNLSIPEYPTYLRFFGAAVATFGTAYYFA
jgi:hypothetical protein